MKKINEDGSKWYDVGIKKLVLLLPVLWALVFSMIFFIKGIDKGGAWFLVLAALLVVFREQIYDSITWD